MKIVDENDSIFTRLLFLHISVRILRTVMYPSAAARSGPSQATKINLFATIVNVFKLTLLTILVLLAKIVNDVNIKTPTIFAKRDLIKPLTCSNAGN